MRAVNFTDICFVDHGLEIERFYSCETPSNEKLRLMDIEDKVKEVTSLRKILIQFLYLGKPRLKLGRMPSGLFNCRTGKSSFRGTVYQIVRFRTLQSFQPHCDHREDPENLSVLVIECNLRKLHHGESVNPHGDDINSVDVRSRQKSDGYMSFLSSR